MSENKLILLSRAGCCLCEGLEDRLRNLELDQLTPPLKLSIRDIDGADVQNWERELYSLQVPVLLLVLERPLRQFELPRVSPRLSEEGLFHWLQKKIGEKLKNI